MSSCGGLISSTSNTRTHTIPYRHTDTQTHIQTYRHPYRETDRQTGRQTDAHTHRQDRQAYRQTDRLTDRQTHRQADTQRDTHTDRQTDRLETERLPGRPPGVRFALRSFLGSLIGDCWWIMPGHVHGRHLSTATGHVATCRWRHGSCPLVRVPLCALCLTVVVAGQARYQPAPQLACYHR